MTELQKRIKEQRQKNNLTLAQLAERLNVKEATVQRYESGEIKNIKHETIIMLSKIFNCSPSYLMGWEDANVEKKNDAITDIILKLRTDSDYLEVVSLLRGLSSEELIAVRTFLSAFKQQ